jgi:uncharacterized membrane protein YkvA (DUF1232 family)
MSGLWLGLIIAAAAATALLGLAALAVWRGHDEEGRRLVRRVGRLPLRRKLALASRLLRDGRVPIALRLLPPALVLYLALPLDIVPDFIPVLGQLDDVLVFAVAVGVLLRFTPREVVEAHVVALEAENDGGAARSSGP